jgi:hypothetical protein
MKSINSTRVISRPILSCIYVCDVNYIHFVTPNHSPVFFKIDQKIVFLIIDY